MTISAQQERLSEERLRELEARYGVMSDPDSRDASIAVAELRALRHKGEGLDEKGLEAAALVLHGQQDYAYDFDREKPAFVRQAGEIVTAYLAATSLQKAQTISPQTPVPEASGIRVLDAKIAELETRARGADHRAQEGFSHTIDTLKAVRRAMLAAAPLEPASPQPARESIDRNFLAKHIAELLQIDDDPRVQQVTTDVMCDPYEAADYILAALRENP